MIQIESMLWHRLDTAGHDACRLEPTAAGWQLQGVAIFREHELPVCLAYQLNCDTNWQTLDAQIQGWRGTQALTFQILRQPDQRWLLNQQLQPDLEACVDLDLGFTPASNLLQIRRIALEPGQSADVPVAWLDLQAGRLALLAQHYQRQSETSYWYTAPQFNYSATLEVAASGFIRSYPRLWEAEL